jgi:LPXTG-motif cell wall-anchored protein
MAVFDPDAVKLTVTPVEEPVETTSATEPTSSTDATSATGKPSTSDSTQDSSGGKTDTSTNGAVQTGTASMALIILLVLASATAGIYFARKRVK